MTSTEREQALEEEAISVPPLLILRLFAGVEIVPESELPRPNGGKG